MTAGHSTYGNSSDYRLGFASCIRTIAHALPERRREVFINMARDAAGYVLRGGLEKTEFVDRLSEAAEACGLTASIGQDEVRALLVDSMAEAVKLQADQSGAAPPLTPTEPRLTLVPWSKIHSLPKRAALVDGVLDQGGMTVCFGGTNTGKTFFALDLCARIALSLDWQGRKIQHGSVIYIAAEGGLGIEERLSGFRLHHEVAIADVPLYLVPEPIDLCRTDGDVRQLLQHIANLPPDPPLRLIVIDTLSRAMAGGDENSSQAMGCFVRNLDHLRIETKAHVMVVHHAGKDERRGARGHSLLRAAADTEIEVTKNEATGIATATIVKQRDHRCEGVFAFRLKTVVVGRGSDGGPVTSCAAVEVEGAAETQGSPKPIRGRLPKAAQTALGALRAAVDECGVIPPATSDSPPGIRVVTHEDWRDYAYRFGISGSHEVRAKQQAFKRATDHLIDGQHIGSSDVYVWLTS